MTGLRVWTAALVLVAAGSAAQARCERTDYAARPDRNTVSKVRMIASAGKDCVLRLSSTRRVTILARRVTLQPEHGRAAVEGETVFYRSLPGYAGPDRFTAEMEGKGPDGAGMATVVVDVQVGE